MKGGDEAAATVMLRGGLIDEFDVAVRRQSNNMSRNAIDDYPSRSSVGREALVTLD